MTRIPTTATILVASTLVASTLAAACASTAAAPRGASDAAPQRATVYTSDGGTLMSDAVIANTADVTAKPEAAWDAVKRVYAGLEIPLTVENPGTRQLGNAEFVKSRNVGGTRMSQLLNCGTGMTGPNADSWRITMSILTDVVPTAQGSNVRVTLRATGKDVAAGASTFVVPCATTGRLESLILERVQAALAPR